MAHWGRVRQILFLALVVDLALGPAPARNCLQCDPSFAVQFASYIPRLSRKSWGLGDVPAAGRRLRGWAQDTLREIHLEVPLEIPFEKLREIAVKIYAKLDTVFRGKTYKPGVLPETLRSIFQEQVSMLRDAIIESRVKCERHCGINWYEAISCETCNVTKPSCFGYNCESSKEWKGALQGLYAYITNLKTTPGELVEALKQLPVFSNCTDNSLENLNFDSINATLSQNWLTAKAKNENSEEAVVVELLKPSCPVNADL
ncbi:PREDICTED: izumo sperm-egg fusion protein 4 [Gekko japonicus]|uniref:Izumo sperm-egg fusion protein 4 n=1 Tax=Gekko japonicus TaxID=146911 RepID=A0ABM1K4K9_GEKJA|nr:PREDICTED: izumo sperm-egg fusion protein 4 [Gekko japonicus]